MDKLKESIKLIIKNIDIIENYIKVTPQGSYILENITHQKITLILIKNFLETIKINLKELNLYFLWEYNINQLNNSLFIVNDEPTKFIKEFTLIKNQIIKIKKFLIIYL